MKGLKELVEALVLALVDHPEEVRITEREENRIIFIELRVAPNDMGKVIGKQGRIARAIRTLVRAAAAREEGKKVIVDITQ
ncbi:MAG: KH domain-containing protein [Peptococcaceae bacterium]|nr:KH domain-containing protein [Peptococcaceae bacterium]MDH7525679.1 KH domain-containing protein [Peptococcaceae bacterium]